MTVERARQDLSDVAVLIPALNEAANLTVLLPELRDMSPGQIIVCDNGSTDDTRRVAESNGAHWVYEPKRGYGAACFAGMEHLSSACRIVVFLNGDLSDDAAQMPALVKPIADGECDFVIGARAGSLREAGSMTLPQRFANRLFPALILLGWGYAYTDLGPFRAVRRDSLEAMGMRDRAFGWTIEMQIRAVELGLRIRELPVPYNKRRRGRGKISGTIRGVVLAAYWITRTCGILWLTKKRRLAARLEKTAISDRS